MADATTMTFAERANLVALELIRRAVADIPGAIASNVARTLAAAAATPAGKPTPAPPAGLGLPGGGAKDLAEFARLVAAAVADRVRDVPTWRGPAVPMPEGGKTPGATTPDGKESDGKKGDEKKKDDGGPSGLKMLEFFGKKMFSLGDMLLGRFTAVLGPIGLFAQMIMSGTSGFNLLIQATKVLTAVLAPILFPVFVSVAAAVLELSDELEARLMPVLKDWMVFVFSRMVPALSSMVDAILAVIDAAAQFVDWVLSINPRDIFDDVVDFAADTASTLSALLPSWIKPAADLAKTLTAADRASRATPGGSGPSEFTADPGAGGSFESDPVPAPAPGGVVSTAFTAAGASADAAAKSRRGGRGAIDDLLASFRLSLGAKASFSGLADVGKQAQIAALNQDPLEARILRAGLRTADAAEEAVALLRKAGVIPPYGTR